MVGSELSPDAMGQSTKRWSGKKVWCILPCREVAAAADGLDAIIDLRSDSSGVEDSVGFTEEIGDIIAC